MYQTPTHRFWAAVLCILTLTIPAAAAEVEAGGIYCFSNADFSQEEGLTGVCITGLPDSGAGTVQLGGRVIRSGDILTAQQTELLTFTPALTQEDRSTVLEYLPIYENRVAPCSAMTIRILGKTDKAPVAEDFALETYKNIPNTGILKVSDPEGQPLTYTVTRQGKRGTVTVDETGSFTYTPKKNKVGVDSFTYTAADPAGNISREATVTVTILKPSDAAPYTDTLGHECRFTAEWMKHTGIFAGETLGQQPCFQPDKAVTRGEFVTMMVKALDIPTEEEFLYTGYTDEIPLWLQPYLAAAMRAGITADLPNREVFEESTPITGAEAAVMVCSALELPVARQTAAGEGESHWAAAALAGANSHGFSLEAEQILNRAQVSALMYRCASLSGESAWNAGI